MEKYFLAPYFSDHTIQAICWALIHSLWIGIVIAALAGLAIALTKKASSNLRYRLLCGLLLLFVAVTAFSFYSELNNIPQNGVINDQVVIAGHNKTIVAPASNIIHNYTFTVAGAKNLLNRFSGWIFTLWLLFFVLKSVKLTRELLYVNQVRNKNVRVVGDIWQNKVISFSNQLGISRAVDILESGLVKVPVTIGYLKPVILLPAGMLLQLPPGQIDTILWHELAHILRRDYLVNILQSIVETVFFFNPAIWWLSALIREEREACCDDIVLNHVQQKRNYLEALLAFQDYESRAGNYAMGLSLRRSQLKNRLKRMINQENQRLSMPEKIVLLSGMVLLSIFTFIPTANSEIRHSAALIKKDVMAVLHTVHPAESKPVQQAVKISQPPAQIKPQINSEPSPEVNDTTRNFTSIIFNHQNYDLANNEMDVRDDKGNHYHLKVADNKITELEVNGAKIADGQLKNYSELLPQISEALDQKKRLKYADNTGFKANSPMAKSKYGGDWQPSKKQTKDNTDLKEYSPMAKSKDGGDWQLSKKQAYAKADTAAPKWSAQSKDKMNGPAAKAQANMVKPVKKGMPPPDITADRQRVRGVIDALVSAKVVPDASAIDWFGLSDTELIINGQKQPAALQQKLKDKYGIRPQNGLYYGPVKMTGTGIFLDKGDL